MLVCCGCNWNQHIHPLGASKTPQYMMMILVSFLISLMRSCKPPSVGNNYFSFFWGGGFCLGEAWILTGVLGEFDAIPSRFFQDQPKYTNQSGDFSWKDRYVPNISCSGSMSKKFTSVTKCVLAFMVCVSWSSACSGEFLWTQQLGGGFIVFLNVNPYLGKWSNLTSIFFKGVGPTSTKTNLILVSLDLE